MRGVAVWSVLVLLWVLLTASLRPGDLVVGGAVAGFVYLLLSTERQGRPRFVRILQVPGFVLWYLGLLVRETGMVALETLRMEPRRSAVVVAVPVEGRSGTRWRLVVLTLLVTFVPGTTVVEIDRQERLLYVHGMGWEAESVRRQTHQLAGRFGRVVS